MVVFTPTVPLAKCPACGGEKQRPVFRWYFSNRVRMECPCGVSGSWRRWDGERPPWHIAAVGWTSAFGEPFRPPPPRRTR